MTPCLKQINIICFKQGVIIPCEKIWIFKGVCMKRLLVTGGTVFVSEYVQYILKLKVRK